MTSSGKEQNIVPNEKSSPSSQENTDTNEMKAIKDAQRLLELIKEKDSDKLLGLLNKSPYSTRY